MCNPYFGTWFNSYGSHGAYGKSQSHGTSRHGWRYGNDGRRYVNSGRFRYENEDGYESDGSYGSHGPFGTDFSQIKSLRRSEIIYW